MEKGHGTYPFALPVNGYGKRSYLSSSSALLIQLLCCRRVVTCCHSYSFAPYPPPQEDKGSIREPQWSARRVLWFELLCWFFCKLLCWFLGLRDLLPALRDWESDLGL